MAADPRATRDRPDDGEEAAWPELLTALAPQGLPYLGSPGDVEAILRRFGGEVHEVLTAFHAGQVTGEVATTRTLGLANAYAGIFNGASPGFRPVGDWNTPAKVGAAVAARQGYGCAPEMGVEVLLRVTATALGDAFVRYLKGEIGDDDARFQVDAAVEDATSALLGLPVSTDD